MPRIYTIGETVLDIVFSNQVPVAAKAGGSMLNASVSLGRLKLPVSFISEFGMDQIGRMVESFLKSNGIDTTFIYRYNEGKSAVALAFLDENQNADYSFYKIYPQERLSIETPPISVGDLVMFGSFYGISSEIRHTLLKILAKARENGAIILYDPNFRKSHLHQLPELLPLIQENIEMAHIIKGSDEDFSTICNAKNSSDAFDFLNNKNKILIYSRGKNGVDFVSKNIIFHMHAREITPVSTIGAGDNFNAGIAFGLFSHKVFPGSSTLSEGLWKEILTYGIDFASEVCLSYDNYISENFASDYLKKLNQKL